MTYFKHSVLSIFLLLTFIAIPTLALSEDIVEEPTGEKTVEEVKSPCSKRCDRAKKSCNDYCSGDNFSKSEKSSCKKNCRAVFGSEKSYCQTNCATKEDCVDDEAKQAEPEFCQDDCEIFHGNCFFSCRYEYKKEEKRKSCYNSCNEIFVEEGYCKTNCAENDFGFLNVCTEEDI